MTRKRASLNKKPSRRKRGLGILILAGLILGSSLAIWLLGNHYWNEFLSPWWEGRVQNRYIQTPAAVKKTWPEEYDLTKGKYSQPGMKGYLAMVQYEYEIDSRRFSGDFSAGNFLQGRASETQTFLDANFPLGKAVVILRHPYKPEFSVAQAEDLPTLAMGIGMGVFTLIPLIACVVILCYSLYVPFARTSHE